MLAASQRIVQLAPLSSAESQALLQGRSATRTLPAQAYEAIAERARGNPLYLLEAEALLREHLASGGREPDSWLALLPPTLPELILARIEALAARHTARLARGLSYRANHAFERARALEEIAAIERALASLLDRLEAGDYADRLTIARCLRRLAQLDFDLLLARMALGEPRPRLHRLATAIRRLADGSTQAHLALLQERLTQDPLGVAREAIEAGDHAWSEQRRAAARDYYQLALEAAPAHQDWSEQRARLWSRLAELAEEAGDLTAARAALEASIAQAGQHLPIQERVRLQLWHAETALRQGDLPAAWTGLTRARRGLTAADRAWWYALAARWARRSGDWRVASTLAHQAWRRAGDDWALARAAAARAEVTRSPRARRRWLLESLARAPDDLHAPWADLVTENLRTG